jgi:DNA-binding beta-propeller fold protein YncE
MLQKESVMTTGTLVGSGKYTYEVNEDWAKLPAGWNMPAAAVAVDSQDRVYCFNRDPHHPIVIFDRHGNYLSSWGDGLIRFAHAILIDDDDLVWLVDRDNEQIMKFTPAGEPLMTIGEKGFRSDTGVDPDNFSSSAYKQVTHGGDPFNLPTDIAIAPSGELFITDGYGNARVHKFTADGTHLFSWGEPGTRPGEFNMPHGVHIDKNGHVLVCDRENDRVQVFTQDGTYVSTWPTKLIGPAVFYVDDDDIIYIPEHNGGMVSILTAEGERLTQWGDPMYRSCHGIWGDSHRDIYVVQPVKGIKGRRIVKYLRQN